MKQRIRLLLLIAGIMFLFFIFGRHFYQKNLSDMRAVADSCFVNVLTSELDSKQKVMSIPYFAACTSDSIPREIRITTAEGTKAFEIDPVKSRKNISRSAMVQDLHSVICEESPLSPDTLNTLWRITLGENKINAVTSVRISVTDFHERVSYLVSRDTVAVVPSSLVFTSYAGNRCEIEICGFLQYSFWQVIWWHWMPFLTMLVTAMILFSLSFYIYRLTRCTKKIEVMTEGVGIYRLCSGFQLDAKRQALLKGDEVINLAPQSCIILKLFLDAAEYTLSDDEILDGVWPKDKTRSIRRFSVASSRLCNALKEHGCLIEFKRVNTDQYRLILPE